MYAWLWRSLPGTRRTRAVLAALLLVVVLTVLVRWVFPAISVALASNGATVAAQRPVLVVNSGQSGFPGSPSSVGAV